MRIKASIKQGEETTVLGEAATKHELADIKMLVIKSDDMTAEDLESFRKSFDSLTWNTGILAVVPKDTDINLLTFDTDQFAHNFSRMKQHLNKILSMCKDKDTPFEKDIFEAAASALAYIPLEYYKETT